MNQHTGVCVYCGQAQTIQTSSELPQDVVNQLVSERCSCEGSMKVSNKSQLWGRIESLFGLECTSMGFDYVCEDEQLELLDKMGMAVMDELYDEVKVKLPGGDTVTMKLVGEDLSISREMKRKRTA